MRELVFKSLCLITSMMVGFAMGYAAMTLGVSAMSPIGLNLNKSTEPFQRTFVEMSRLGEAETVLRSCTEVSDPSTRQTLLAVESDVINDLRKDAKSSGLAPPLDVAAGIVEIRRNAGSRDVATEAAGPATSGVNDLLTSSGWPEDSARVLSIALANSRGLCKRRIRTKKVQVKTGDEGLWCLGYCLDLHLAALPARASRIECQ
jgi:hypothetical protein